MYDGPFALCCEVKIDEAGLQVKNVLEGDVILPGSPLPKILMSLGMRDSDILLLKGRPESFIHNQRP